jgi:hypothetical protein
MVNIFFIFFGYTHEPLIKRFNCACNMLFVEFCWAVAQGAASY